MTLYKKLSAAILILLFLFFGWFFLLQKDENKEADNPIPSVKSIAGEKPEPALPVSGLEDRNLHISENDNKDISDLTVMGDKADAEIVKKWLWEHGEAINFKNEDYSGYSKEQLEKIASSGDIIALSILAKISQDAGDYKKARDLYLQGVLHGSTAALKDLSQMSFVDSFSKKGEDKKADIIESMAYLKVASMLGDNTFYFLDISSPMADKAHVYINESEYANVISRAQELYGNLQDSRVSLGLGGFDSSSPEAVKKYFDQVDPRNRGFKARY